MLILRVVLGGFLVQDGFSPSIPGTPIPRSIAAFAALFLILGTWTPIVSLSVALLEIWIAAESGRLWPFLMTSAIGIALALIGPGAHSIDAKRFGRKRVIFEERGD